MALNLPPEIMQNQAYTASRWRRYVEGMGRIQQGVYGTGAFNVTRQASGWGINIAGGSAYIPRSTSFTSNVGLYHVEADPGTASLTSTITPADATNPRIDSVVIEVHDSSAAPEGIASANDTQQITVLTGTPTSGATLGNRNGAAASPTSNYLRLADILVPAGAASIQGCTVRDRRMRALGVFAYSRTGYASPNVVAGSGGTFSSPIIRAELGRARLSGAGLSNIIDFGFLCNKMSHTTAGGLIVMTFEYQQSDSGTWTAMNSARNPPKRFTQANSLYYVQNFDRAQFTGGNYQFRATITNNSAGTMNVGDAGSPFIWWVREIVNPSRTSAMDSP